MNKLLFIPLLMLFLVSCESEYSSLVKQEMDSGEIHEELLLELKMGQTRKEFHEICWNLNSKGIIGQGPGNKYAKYVMPPLNADDDSTSVDMLFYGMFDDDKIMYGMDMKLHFVRWSLWNQNFSPERLIEYMKDRYMKTWGGNEFIPIDINEETKAFVKVDGNRQIVIYKLDDMDIAIKIKDLRTDRYSISKKEII